MAYELTYNFINENAYEVTGYTGDPDYVIIPSSYDDGTHGEFPVISVGDNSFEYCESLISVEIPEGVTRLGDNAFGNCPNLTTLVIPDGVTYLGEWLICNCTQLTQLHIPDSVTEVGEGVLAYSGLTSVILPNSITDIKDYTLEGCESLVEAVLPSDITYIGEFAFECCYALSNVIIPDNVTRIGAYAFCECSSLETLSIPSGVTSIEDSAFAYCDSLQFNEYDNGLYLGNNENHYLALIQPKDTSIENCIINENTKVIYEYVFLDCTSLVSIAIPDGVTSIVYGMFRRCSSLESVTIPDSVTSIEEEAFFGCSSLTNITIPDSVTSIGGKAFMDCSSLTSIEIPDSVTSIGDSAFYNCSSLTSITIPNGVSSISVYAFRGCSSLTSVVIPDSVASISQYAFYGCSSLTSINIPDSVTSIGYQAFYRCSSLASITIGSGVTSIDQSAFGGCPIVNASIPAIACSYIKNQSLTEVRITSGTSIENSAFSGCSLLASITIPDSVVSIGSKAFYNCNSLNSVYYTGTQEQWNILLNNVGTGNSPLLNATLYLVKLLTYITNGGTLEQGADNPYIGETYPDPLPTCSKQNFTFGGWYKDNSYQTAVVAGDPITDDAKNIYAKLSSSITYVLNGGTNNALNKNEYYPYDITGELPIYPATKVGKDFDGWYTESTFANKIETFGDLDGSTVILYAKFSAKKSYAPKIKTENGDISLPLDAKTVRGYDAYVSISISDFENMGELYKKISDINSKNTHAIFDFSSLLDNAYACLIKMYAQSGKPYCEIIDLIGNKSYYNPNGFSLTDRIDEYIESSIVKDNYENITLAGLTTMGELREFVNSVNVHGDHCFFDFDEYVEGAYVCTVQMYTQNSVNYCFIFDILNGKLYGSYTGYEDDIDIVEYCDGRVTSDLIHAISLDYDITLQGVIQLINRVNVIGHHVFLDVSAMDTSDYLVTFTYNDSDEDLTECSFMGLTKGVSATHSYTDEELSDTLFSEFLELGTKITNSGSGDNLPTGGNNGDVLTKVATDIIAGNNYSLKQSYTTSELMKYLEGYTEKWIEYQGEDYFEFYVSTDIVGCARGTSDGEILYFDYLFSEFGEVPEDGWYQWNDDEEQYESVETPIINIPEDISERGEFVNISSLNDLKPLLDVEKDSVEWKSPFPTDGKDGNVLMAVKGTNIEPGNTYQVKQSYTKEELTEFLEDRGNKGFTYYGEDEEVAFSIQSIYLGRVNYRIYYYWSNPTNTTDIFYLFAEDDFGVPEDGWYQWNDEEVQYDPIEFTQLSIPKGATLDNMKDFNEFKPLLLINDDATHLEWKSPFPEGGNNGDVLTRVGTDIKFEESYQAKQKYTRKELKDFIGSYGEDGRGIGYEGDQGQFTFGVSYDGIYYSTNTEQGFDYLFSESGEVPEDGWYYWNGDEPYEPADPPIISIPAYAVDGFINISSLNDLKPLLDVEKDSVEWKSPCTFGFSDVELRYYYNGADYVAESDIDPSIIGESLANGTRWNAKVECTFQGGRTATYYTTIEPTLFNAPTGLYCAGKINLNFTIEAEGGFEHTTSNIAVLLKDGETWLWHARWFDMPE